jgi:hypothetical protein
MGVRLSPSNQRGSGLILSDRPGPSVIIIATLTRAFAVDLLQMQQIEIFGSI